MSGHEVTVTVTVYSNVNGNNTVPMTFNGFPLCLGLVCEQNVAAKRACVQRPVVLPPQKKKRPQRHLLFPLPTAPATRQM